MTSLATNCYPSPAAESVAGSGGAVGETRDEDAVRGQSWRHLWRRWCWVGQGGPGCWLTEGAVWLDFEQAAVDEQLVAMMVGLLVVVQQPLPAVWTLLTDPAGQD